MTAVMRRLRFVAIAIAVLGTTPHAAIAADPDKAAPFVQEPLPYAADALEPAIDKATMEIHYGRHHAAYVKALNEAVQKLPELRTMPLDEILAGISKLPPAVRNNGGGHYNHSLFWTLMAQPGSGGEPSPALKQQVAKDFGSWDAFTAAFEESGRTRFGSGWAWLVWTDGRLVVTSTPNQDNPLMDVVEIRGAPILANDLWEHAYYLKYQNKRADYLKAWWSVVNWNRVNALFEAASK